ncbi:MAG: hypothetical protein ACOYNZ_13920 [Rhodoferax sp.]
MMIVIGLTFLASCSSMEPVNLQAPSAPVTASTPNLVGAWEVTASRAKSVGKNLLTFSSDGTFFRSGDTHPVVSGGHGAWKLVGPNQYSASYVSFSFDQTGKWVGVNRNNLLLTLAADGNLFQGMVKGSNRDLEDNVVSTSSSPLAGKRILVQPF